MALAFEIIIEYEDEDGDRATHAVEIPTTFTIAQYTEFAQALVQLKDAVSLCRISNCSLGVSADLSGLSNNLLDESADVEDVGAFQFLSAENFPVNVNIPGLSEVVVAAGSDDIDQAHVNVAPFITAMEDGIAVTGGTIIPCDIGEEDIISLVFARENFRPSGRR